jgi:hypothetical protein
MISAVTALGFFLASGSGAVAQRRDRTRGRTGGEGEKVRGASATKKATETATEAVPLRGPGAYVAVQPIDGAKTELLRQLVARIVQDRGFRPVTGLPRYEGTAQYPVLARDYQLAALVTADMEDLGQRQRITFLVWSGHNGSIVGRWTVAASTTVLPRTVSKGFWAHLGPAIRRARGPGSTSSTPHMTPARPMRIDASNPEDRVRFSAQP